MKIQFECKYCHKKSHEQSRVKLDNFNFITLDCGHTYSEELSLSGLNEIILADNRKLYPFQVQGVKFLENNNFKGLISDEMGLGKTIQAVGAINLHHEKLAPILIVVKASLTFQWLKEIVGGSNQIAQILDSKTTPIPGLKIYITSYDSIPARKAKNGNGEKKGGLLETIKKLGIKTLILDECQRLKNHLSSRTQAIREIVRGNGDDKTVEHLIALSGTPITNNAIEYFPILNLLRPERFWNRDYFIRWEVEHYWDGKTNRAGGLRYPKEFIEKNSDFIIRRNRSEVLPDLPRIQRDYKYYPMMQEVQDAYNKKVKKLSDFLDEEEKAGKGRFESQGQLLAQLQILRHITGLSKLEPVIDYVMEFIEDNPGEKLTIFHHHIDVGKILASKLEELIPGGTIQMTSGDNAEERTDKIEKFKSNEASRILIAPTLACGEGINLQFCSKAIIMEREWNPANEEQAEGRFSRIGSEASSILVCYPTAIGTIDEFFAELVERKREAIGKTLDGKAEPWDQSSVMRELAMLVVKKWKNQ